MLLFPPYFFAMIALITFVIGFCLGWFTNRTALSISLGVAGVIFASLFVLDWTLPGQDADPIWFIGMLGAIYALSGGIPALFGAAVARNLKGVVLK
ncbi:MAG: hypothetical protein AAGK01_04270 [Pseudomonadota bacterium]